MMNFENFFSRYADITAPLTEYFSEYVFLRDRVRVELDFLSALSKTGLVRPLTVAEFARIGFIFSSLFIADAESILEYERITRHDVKAVEYFYSEQIPKYIPDGKTIFSFDLFW